MANSRLSPFIPFYFGGKDLPEAYHNAELAYYDPASASWRFHEVGQLCYRNYEIAANKIVIPAFREMENNLLENQENLGKYFCNLYKKIKRTQEN